MLLFPDPTDPPGKPVVVDSAKNFIKIQWDKPKKDGGAPVTGYNIERKDPRTGTWNKLNDEPVKVLSCYFYVGLSPIYVSVSRFYRDTSLLMKTKMYEAWLDVSHQ